eukprot:TRINITY_DN28264_c0_g1_i1.p1 TRINITY_DN28264_c0_g1~~TRINITY_DN28264_c0_g1_i1.p1  ORF type:complete len:362 (+),score=47.84 TRINITY_DN28264_c0_g1_i1:29-1087(+)
MRPKLIFLNNVIDSMLPETRKLQRATAATNRVGRRQVVCREVQGIIDTTGFSYPTNTYKPLETYEQEEREVMRLTTVDGGEDLVRYLKSLPYEVQDNVVNLSLGVAAKRGHKNVTEHILEAFSVTERQRIYAKLILNQRLGRPRECEAIIKSLPASGGHYAALIASHARLGDEASAFKTFKKMRRDGIAVTADTCMALLRSAQSLRTVQKILKMMTALGIETRNIAIYTITAQLYFTLCNHKAALSVLLSAKKTIGLDVVAFNLLMDCLSLTPNYPEPLLAAWAEHLSLSTMPTARSYHALTHTVIDLYRKYKKTVFLELLDSVLCLAEEAGCDVHACRCNAQLTAGEFLLK